MSLRNFGLHAALLATLSCCGFAAHAAPPDDIDQLVHTVMIDGRLDFPLDELEQRARSLQEDLHKWQERHADDVRGIIAAAQITWLLDRLQPHVARDADDNGGSERNQEARRQLQQALDRRPENADLHYWRAQLLASPIIRQIEGHLTARPIDRPAAIEAAQRAWNLDGSRDHFRDALATLLADDYRDTEAMTLLRAHDGVDSPLGLLLQDLEALPLPQDAVFLEEDSRRFAEDQMARGRVSDAPYVRARVYLLRGEARLFEAHCQKLWPAFRLLTADASNGSNGPAWRRHAMQVLLLGGDDPRPIADLAQLDVAAMDGISLTLIELDHPPDAQRRQSPAGAALPVDLGDVYVYLYVLNDRTLH